MAVKIKNILKKVSPLIRSVLLTLVIVGMIFVVIGFISFLINIVCTHPTTLFQRLAFYIGLAVSVFISWFCLTSKEEEK